MPLLFEGTTKSFFPESSVYLTDKAPKAYARQRCVVQRWVANKERFEVKLWDPKYQGQRVLVSESQMSFDHWSTTPELLMSLPPSLTVKDDGVAGDSLYINKDVSKGSCVLIESPLLVVNNKGGFESRWNAHFGLEFKNGPRSPVLEAFKALSDGDLTEEYKGDAKTLFKNILTATHGKKEAEQFFQNDGMKDFVEQEVQNIAGVLARWQSNGHMFKIRGCNEEGGHSAVFRWTCKMLHCCDPNCYLAQNQASLVEVRTLRDVKKGEALTHCYMGGTISHLNWKERRAKIQKARGFECICPRCVKESREDPNPEPTKAKKNRKGGEAIQLELEEGGSNRIEEITGDDEATGGAAEEPATQAAVADGLPCSACKVAFPKASYSKKQLQKGNQRRCKPCTQKEQDEQERQAAEK